MPPPPWATCVMPNQKGADARTYTRPITKAPSTPLDPAKPAYVGMMKNCFKLICWPKDIILSKIIPKNILNQISVAMALLILMACGALLKSVIKLPMDLLCCPFQSSIITTMCQCATCWLPQHCQPTRWFQSSSGPTLTSLPSVIPSSSVSLTSGPSSSFGSTLWSSLTQQCKAAGKSECGCKVANWVDYCGTINKTADGVMCERWDSNPYGIQQIQNYPNAGLDENFCHTPGAMVPYCIASFEEYGIIDLLKCDVPMCNPCSCMPPCGQPNEEKCNCPSAVQAEACCEDGNAKCKCIYLKDACHTSLQNNSTDFCDEAQAECCKVDNTACKCGY